MAIRNPPPGFPVRIFPSPKVTDQVLLEWVNVESGSYIPLEPGAPHPDQRQFAGFRLGVQRANPQDHNFIQRIWVTDETDQDTYNYALKFSAEAITAPIFIRTYREPKNTYERRATLSPLGSIYKLVLTENGTGYAVGALPPITFSDPATTPTSVATGHGVVNPDGTIEECILDSNGEGYAEDVAFTVEPPSNGTQASGIAYVQPITAYLVKEEANLFPQESEFYADYFQVTRVYETLPGPFVDSTRFRSDGSTILVAKRRNITADIVPGGDLTAGLLTLTRIGEGDAFTADEIREISSVPGPDVHGEHIDPRHGIVIDITKTIVPDGTDGGIIAGAYVDINPHDKWQAVQIASKLDPDSLPDPVITYGGQYHSFPPELSDAIIQYAEATCGCVDKFTSVLQANFARYSGMVKARYTEQFYNGVPPDDVVIDQFFPQAHVFGFAFASTCGCGSDSTARVSAIAPQYRIPLCLHDTLNLNVGVSFTWSFPATTPAALPHSTYIMLAPHVERWRFGVFRRVLTEVFVP